MKNINYINFDKLKKDIREAVHAEKDFMDYIRIIANQQPVDVIPVDFIKAYIEEQETGSVYQWAIHALLGAWILEKGKQNED